jgi:hypothetical protein
MVACARMSAGEREGGGRHHDRHRRSAAVCWIEVAEIVGRLLDRPVDVRTMGSVDDVAALGPVVTGLLAAAETYDSVLDMSEPAATFGVRLTPMEEALRPFLPTSG